MQASTGVSIGFDHGNGGHIDDAPHRAAGVKMCAGAAQPKRIGPIATLCPPPTSADYRRCSRCRDWGRPEGWRCRAGSNSQVWRFAPTHRARSLRAFRHRPPTRACAHGAAPASRASSGPKERRWFQNSNATAMPPWAPGQNRTAAPRRGG